MVAHVENLRMRQDRNAAELEEAKKTIQQQNSSRNIIDPRASPGSFFTSVRLFVWRVCHGRHLTDECISCRRSRGQWQQSENISQGTERKGLIAPHLTSAHNLISLLFLLEKQPSKDQCFNNSQSNTGKKVSLLGSPTFPSSILCGFSVCWTQSQVSAGDEVTKHRVHEMRNYWSEEGTSVIFTR